MPKNTTLYLVRHGQSAANAGEVTHDPASIPLTETGREQARKLAAGLGVQPTAVIVSHYQRAIDTAQPFCQRWGIAAVEHPLLHEFVTLSPAQVNGTTVAARKPLVEAYWEAADPQCRHGDDAESFIGFAARVSAFRETLDTLADGTAIFGHGMWFAMLIWQLQGFGWRDGLSMRAFRRYQLGLPMPNCAVYALRSQRSGVWSVHFNEDLFRHVHHGDAQAEARAAVMAGA